MGIGKKLDRLLEIRCKMKCKMKLADISFLSRFDHTLIPNTTLQIKSSGDFLTNPQGHTTVSVNSHNIYILSQD